MELLTLSKNISESMLQIPIKYQVLIDIITFICNGKTTLKICDHTHSMWTFLCIPIDRDLPHPVKILCTGIEMKNPSFALSK